MKTLPVPHPSTFSPLRFTAFALACAGLVALAAAQTTPTTPQSPQTPPTTQPQQGWHFFDEATGRSLQLDNDRLERLRAVDDSYRQRYHALGTTPWTADGYDQLTQRREAEIRGILTPEQYDRWTTMQATRKVPTPHHSSPTTPRQ